MRSFRQHHFILIGQSIVAFSFLVLIILLWVAAAAHWSVPALLLAACLATALCLGYFYRLFFLRPVLIQLGDDGALTLSTRRKTVSLHASEIDRMGVAAGPHLRTRFRLRLSSGRGFFFQVDDWEDFPAFVGRLTQANPNIKTARIPAAWLNRR